MHGINSGRSAIINRNSLSIEMKTLAVLILLFGVLMISVIAQPKVRAPELSGAKSWLNTDKPLTLAGLRGKVVLLDFWTYGCINCVHIIPDLKRLEAKYPNQLVVIGVHSAKFTNEGDTANIRNIIMRYGIEHPVANDADFRIWHQYAVNAWPTQVVIDPAGYVIGAAAGEGYAAEIDALIGQTVDEFRKKGQLDERPQKFALERAKVGAMPLAFPGKVIADEKSRRLFIADSNHNRIVIADFDGKLIDVVGSGDASARDGDFASATFNRPQGMALDGETLFVADTENHLIRRVDLRAEKVSTVAGTGRLSDFDGEGGGGLSTGLRSPWDLTIVGRKLFIAMAGSHQIWTMDLNTSLVAPFAGSRVEARLDGKLKLAGFAQPSGIVSDGKRLFVADSESNIIRLIDLSKERVETLAGGDLFDFGDRDGKGDEARFQHPLGVAFQNGRLLIADTYNHKIKSLDPVTGNVVTLFGNGRAGQTDGRVSTFYEPGGIAVAGDRLFVADTNNHAIRVVDLKSGNTSTLRIDGLRPSQSESASRSNPESPNRLEIVAPQTIFSSNSKNEVTVLVNLPRGYHLNPNAPSRFEISSDSKGVVPLAGSGKIAALPVTIPVSTAAAGDGAFSVRMTIYYCREDDTGVCLIRTIEWKVPFTISKDGKTAVRLTADVPGPE